MADARLWWQLSFADETGFLGGLVVPAETLFDAITWSHFWGLNPGGEVSAIAFRATAVDRACVNRLLSADETRAMPMPENAEVLSQQEMASRASAIPSWFRG